MLVIIAAILALLWLLGISIHVGGSVIHLLLVIALVVFIYDMLTRRHTTI